MTYYTLFVILVTFAAYKILTVLLSDHKFVHIHLVQSVLGDFSELAGGPRLQTWIQYLSNCINSDIRHICNLLSRAVKHQIKLVIF